MMLVHTLADLLSLSLALPPLAKLMEWKESLFAMEIPIPSLPNRTRTRPVAKQHGLSGTPKSQKKKEVGEAITCRMWADAAMISTQNHLFFKRCQSSSLTAKTWTTKEPFSVKLLPNNELVHWCTQNALFSVGQRFVCKEISCWWIKQMSNTCKCSNTSHAHAQSPISHCDCTAEERQQLQYDQCSNAFINKEGSLCRSLSAASFTRRMMR